MVASRRPPISFARETGSLTLEDLLGEARDAYVDELAIPLTVDQPPALRDRNADGSWTTHAARGAQIGYSMSPQLYRRLGHPADDYGDMFPMARALDDLRGWCTGRHLEARSGPWLDHVRDTRLGPGPWRRLMSFRPLCARLAFYSVVTRVPLSRLADVEELDVDRTADLLRQALVHAWDQRREWAHAADSGATEVMAALRREHRDARRRAEAVTTVATVCRYCERPYDATSEEPCPGLTLEYAGEAIDTTIYTELGFTVLCTPA